VEIVERAAGPTSEGAGIYLPGNAVRALHALGLGTQVVDSAAPIAVQRTADHRGRLLFDVDVAQWWSGVGPCVALRRAALHQILLAGIEDVPIRWGAEPAALQVETNGVTVGFGTGHSERYDVVLGADGVHSSVRRLVFGPEAIRPVGQVARRFVLPWPQPHQPQQPDQPDQWSVLLGRGSAFLTIPIGDGLVYCYCDGPPGEPPQPLDVLLADYAEPVPSLLAALDAAGETSVVQTGVIEEVALESWSRGGVLLIGDAAHATSPNMAQGVAMALEDALVLVGSLTAAADLRAALEAYEQRRRRRTDWVRAQTHRRDRARSLPPALRGVALRWFGQRVFESNYAPLREQP